VIGPIDNITDTVDIGAYLKAGENEIEIKLASLLFNRSLMEGNDSYMRIGAGPGNNNMIASGLRQVSIVPYYDAVVAKQATHTVTFDTTGGSEIEPVEVPDGETVDRPADPVKDGYTFIGWLQGGETCDYDSPI
jgi:hypothetical protein